MVNCVLRCLPTTKMSALINRQSALVDRQVHYVGTFNDGTVFDSSRELGEPYEFLVGSTRVVPGFSDAVAGLSVGQSRRQTLTPADAYGASLTSILDVAA